MIFDLFKKNKAEEDKPSLPTPLNLRLGSAVELDLLPFQMIRQQLNLTLPSGVQTIEAVGTIDLGGGSSLCRFYTADDGFFQISTTGGFETQHINDIKLFVFEQTENLASQSGVNLWVSDHGKIGQPGFTLNSTQYERAWDSEVTGKIEPVRFTETVYSRDKNTATYDVDHLAMLYQRRLSNSGHYEYLLSSLEFTSDDEATAVISVGIDLEISSMSIM
ncbi:DUF2491 family protein [Endozoicomonas numazuensis]|uniref:DUF2491 domain-containing protein n=1 Tax=Endozoicomonas numazuensis TaxID=1137799 RepID=A0A081NHL8_9GAMM|nr:DUF2491 family protein [Endozoicomonas numazuensis]KEQ17941.1 hypothetical protein GZ78_09990 [Endozoicomonas numazuensis]